MNRKDIIRMAREAWLSDKEAQLITEFDEAYISCTYLQDLERFAKLVAEHERDAWRNAAIRVGEDLCSVGPFGYYDMTAQQWLDWALSVVTVHAPPRQPLTDEEIGEIGRKHEKFAKNGNEWFDRWTFARAIEAAVWEKQK